MTPTTDGYARTLAQLLTDTIGALPPTTRPLTEAIGWRLAADLKTQFPSPRFDNSQMDGYGIGYANIAGGRFRVGPDVPAGTDPAEIYHYGVNGYGHDTAVPIMTGAQIPEDVVAIIPVERANPPEFVETGQHIELPAVEVGTFIRKTAEDMPAGTVFAREGDLIDATLVATAASQGMTDLPVASRMTMAIIAGGDEVVTAGTPVNAKIFDANTPLVTALATTYGIEIVATGSTSDDLRDFRSVLDRIIADHTPDVVITSGGISAGKYEVVRQLLERLPVSWVGAVQQQPGGPQGYGVYGSTPIIALPGNPISTLVSLRMLVVPAIWQTFGTGTQPVAVQARLMDATTGIRGKTQYRRAVVGLHGPHVIVKLQGDAGSHLLAQAVGANALVEVPPMARLNPGQTVTAHLLADSRWSAVVTAEERPEVSESPRMQQPAPVSADADKTALVIIASTRAAAGIYSDDVGPKLTQWLRSKGFSTPDALVVADHDLEYTVEQLVVRKSGPMPDVIITSGGTGISPTDQTVEVIEKYLTQRMPNVMSAILQEGLKNTPHAALSRGIAGVMGRTFVVTLPGSIGGVEDGMTVLERLIDHIVEQLRGEDHSR